MLDTRQYRSNQPCEVNGSATCDKRFDPDLTVLGGKQKRWLLDGFSASSARWQVLGNQAPMGQFDNDQDPRRTRSSSTRGMATWPNATRFLSRLSSARCATRS